MPRRTRASGVVVGDDRDAGDATVFEGGFRDHRCFCSWFDGEWEGRAGKLYESSRKLSLTCGQRERSDRPVVTRLGSEWYDVAVRPI